VAGLVLKETAASGLVDAIHAVARGEQFIPPLLARRALELANNRFDADGMSLTPREREIVMAVADGHSNKRVASDLGIAEGTVKLHLHKAYKKLGVTNRVQLSLMVRAQGWT
jgi:DNA-binding NarL/FixJ family response regulator